MPTVERLVVTPELAPRKAGEFTASLESTGEPIVRGTRQPLVDGARALLARGFDPATPITLRHLGRSYDSFEPLPLRQWAAWTYKEGEKRTLTRALWRPFADITGEQKSGAPT